MQSVISKLALRERKTRQIFIAYTMNHNLNYKMYLKWAQFWAQNIAPFYILKHSHVRLFYLKILSEIKICWILKGHCHKLYWKYYKLSQIMCPTKSCPYMFINRPILPITPKNYDSTCWLASTMQISSKIALKISKI